MLALSMQRSSLSSSALSPVWRPTGSSPRAADMCAHIHEHEAHAAAPDEAADESSLMSTPTASRSRSTTLSPRSEVCHKSPRSTTGDSPRKAAGGSPRKAAGGSPRQQVLSATKSSAAWLKPQERHAVESRHADRHAEVLGPALKGGSPPDRL